MKLVVLLLFAAVASAQTTSSSGALGGVISAGPSGVMSSGGWTFPGGTVTGMPYSAEQVTEHVQTLADGTHITQTAQKTTLFRDSQGRTRTERTFLPLRMAAAEGAGPGMVEIADPVNGVRYSLDVRGRVAHKILFPPPPPPPSGSGPGPATAQVRKVLPASVQAPSSPAPDSETKRPKFSRESLGTQMIEGVSAEGSRMTVIYPIGFVGNDRPITTVSETWTSTELKMVVLSKTSDPRTGEVTTMLTNIIRAEPSPALFQVAPDYRVIEPQTASPNR